MSEPGVVFTRKAARAVADLVKRPAMRPNRRGAGWAANVAGDADEMAMGIIVCAGPAGEADFTDSRYWVAEAKPSVQAGRLHWHLVAGGWVVQAENLFECGTTHFVDPQSPVEVHFRHDDQDNVANYFLVAAEGCQGECPSSSSASGASDASSASASSESASSASSSSLSSSSSSAVTCCSWQANWNCETESWSNPVWTGDCGGEPVYITWHRNPSGDPPAGRICAYEIQNAPVNGRRVAPPKPTYVPTDCEKCSESSSAAASSSAGSATPTCCSWQAVWDCDTETWSDWAFTGYCTGEPVYTTPHRNPSGDPAGNKCAYELQTSPLGGECIAPPKLTAAPTDCEKCASSAASSGGSGSGGETFTGAKTIIAEMRWSVGSKCIEVRKETWSYSLGILQSVSDLGWECAINFEPCGTLGGSA